eukprot:TRINITY_DN33265_c0_g1_i1.p1 TRINITY_DN33265_c0_g1~~TRINITY_DN33265_c0_g1_i1.p1  ORF type:complete len:774 (-),score=156.02 TRINITY_DN33265_c0_g1_i1:1360-3402(-)
MQRNVEKLRTASQFRGKPDPVHGDAYNQKVRDSAQAAIESAFAASKVGETRTRDITSQSAANVGGLLQPTQKSTFTTGNKIDSMGYSAQRNEDEVAAGDKTAAGMLGQFAAAAKTGFGAWAPSEHDKMVNDIVTNNMNAGQSYQAPIIAPSFGASTPSSNSTTSGAGTAPTKTWGGGFRAPEATTEAEVKETPPEVKVVKDLLSIKAAQPTRAQLSDFVAKANGLDLEQVFLQLDDSLDEKQNWQIRLRGLCGIEALLGSSVTNDSTSAYFKENPEDIMRNVNVVQQSLKDKAAKVLRLLGLEAPKTEKRPQPQAVPGWGSPDAPEGSTLDFAGLTMKKKDEPEQTKKLKTRKRVDAALQQQNVPLTNTSLTSASESPPPEDSGAANLFGGLTTHAVKPKPPTPQPVTPEPQQASPPPLLQPQQETPPPQTAPTLLQPQQAVEPTPPPAPQPEAKKPTTDLDDLFSFTDTPSAPTPTPAPTTAPTTTPQAQAPQTTTAPATGTTMPTLLPTLGATGAPPVGSPSVGLGGAPATAAPATDPNAAFANMFAQMNMNTTAAATPAVPATTPAPAVNPMMQMMNAMAAGTPAAGAAPAARPAPNPTPAAPAAANPNAAMLAQMQAQLTQMQGMNQNNAQMAQMMQMMMQMMAGGQPAQPAQAPPPQTDAFDFIGAEMAKKVGNK